MKRILCALVLALGTACGGQVASQEPRVDEVGFHPSIGTAGYTFRTGYALYLVDHTTNRAPRTLEIQLTDVVPGVYSVASGRAQCIFAEGHSRSFRAVRGTVMLTVGGGATRPGAFGTVRGHVDLVLADEADGSHEIHVVADYEADVTTAG